MNIKRVCPANRNGRDVGPLCETSSQPTGSFARPNWPDSPRLCGQRTPKVTKLLLYLSSLVSATLLISSGLACSELLGEVTIFGSLVGGVLFAVLIGAAAAAFGKQIKFFNLGFAIVCLSTTLWFVSQIFLLRQKQDEIINLVSRVEKDTQIRGSYPKSLDDILSGDPDVRRELVRNCESHDDYFIVFYTLVTPSISHWYDSRYGWAHSYD